MSVHELHLDLPARNAIDPGFLDHAEAAFAAADGGAVLLRGTERAFCAGLNLKLLPELDGADMEAFLVRVDRFFRAVFEHPGPVVACVEGHAIAGGCVLLQACDARVVTDRPEVRLGVNELALGACYPPNALAVVAARLPRRHVERVVLGAELFSPQEALALGLVDRVEADPLAAARAEAARLASHPPEAYAYVKRELRAGALPDEATVARWHEEALPQWSSQALRDRIRAALGG